MTKETSNFKYQTANSGFTLIELLVVVFVTATLTGIVTVNFRVQRSQQELSAAANDLISKVREIQATILAGQEVTSGVAPDAYEFTFTANSASYDIDYLIGGSPTDLETVNLPQNIEISALRVGGVPTTPVDLRLTSPFGKISVNTSNNQLLEIDLTHTTQGTSRTVLIDGVTGRIGNQ